MAATRETGNSAPHGGCPFCSPERELPEDGVVTLGHYDSAVRSVMIAPTRHVTTLAELTDEEGLSLHRAVLRLQRQWSQRGAVEMNVIWNLGAAAGQTVAHVHCHILERGREGDRLPGFGPRWWLKRPLRGAVLLRLLARLNPGLGMKRRDGA